MTVWEAKGPAISGVPVGPQVPELLVVQMVGKSWLLASGSHHPELNLQLTLQLSN